MWKAERTRPIPILAPARWQYCSTVNQIRPPRRNELALLRRIERDASQRFAEIGLLHPRPRTAGRNAPMAHSRTARLGWLSGRSDAGPGA
jgi:hypothetical protein